MIDEDEPQQECIHRFSGEHRFLSNFYPCQVTFEGVTYNSTEAAYVAAKSLNQEFRLKVSQLPSPSACKRLGREISLRDDWEDVKLGIMEELLRKKFSQEPLKQMLRDTYPALLVEGNTWGDTFWGVCKGVGQNHLGSLLMKVREDLRREYMNLYGKVLQLQDNPKGITFAKVEDLNQKKEIVITAGEKGTFKGEVLKVGDRFKCKIDDSGKTNIVVSKVVKYEEKPKTTGNDAYLKAVIFGNAVNVATTITIKKKLSELELFQLATEIYHRVPELRAELKEKYPAMKDNDLGAKIGDSLKRAAELSDARKKVDLDNLLADAKHLCELHIQAENSL